MDEKRRVRAQVLLVGGKQDPQFELLDEEGRTRFRAAYLDEEEQAVVELLDAEENTLRRVTPWPNLDVEPPKED